MEKWENTFDGKYILTKLYNKGMSDKSIHLKVVIIKETRNVT
jgi:hypothetical protein